MDIRAMADEEPSSQETDVNWVWMAPGRRGSAPPPLRNVSQPGPRNVHFQDTPITPSEPPASVQLHNLGMRNQQIQLQQFRDMHLSQQQQQQQQQQNINIVPTTITITPPPFISSSPSFSGLAFSQGQTAMRAPMGDGTSRPMEDQQAVSLPQIQDGQFSTPIAYATVTQLPPASTLPSSISNPIPIPKFSPVSGSYFISPTSLSPPPVISPPMSPTFGSPSPNSSAGSSPSSSRSSSPSRGASSSSSSSSSSATTPKKMSSDKHSPTVPGDKNKFWKFKTHPYSFKTQQHSKSTKFKFHYFQPEIVEQAEGGTITKLRKTM
eukprot:TRINITY_DN1869_c0_g1_i4.p1 TRINITY_DN1869_c0_g1~~TRINITY_DN1869_c0_g1_i4.p1  ORF type:complete len:333 (+),score=133.34 TRINITY_DN1869_c0_g1_i4:36-1001(+)